MSTAKDLKVAPISSGFDAMFTGHSVEAVGKFAPFGYVYLLRWPGELVKIGSTKVPYTRMRKHSHDYPGEVWLLGQFFKFSTPALAAAVEKHLQIALEARAVTEELFEWPELARGEREALCEFEVLAREVFQNRLNLRLYEPEAGSWQMPPESWEDRFIHAASSPCYWEATIPLPVARKVHIPAIAEKRSQALKAVLKNPKVQAKKAATMKVCWSDPEYKARVSAAIKSAGNRPEVKDKLSAAGREKWRDPAFRTKTSASIRAALASPAIRAERAANMKARWADPNRRAQLLKGLKGVAKSPRARKFNHPAQGSLF